MRPFKYSHQGKRLFILSLFLIFLAGCTQPGPQIVATAPTPAPVFPPQKAMESGDYAGFVKENEQALEGCGEGKTSCEEPLFNLGFVYAYSKSPYYDQFKALKYLERLVKEHPHSPLAFQATAWTDLIKRHLVSESRQRRLRSEIRAIQATMASKDEMINIIEAEISSKRAELSTHEATITELQDLIKRSQEIDLEIEQRERRLLQ